MTPRLLEFTSSGPVGSLICGVEDGVVRGVVWLVVAPQPMAAKALNRIMFRIKDMAESSAIDRSNAGAVRRLWMGRGRTMVRVEQLAHLFIGSLVEIQIPLTDRRKRFRCSHTNDLVSYRRQRRARVARADGHRDDDPGGCQQSHCLDRGHHG